MDVQHRAEPIRDYFIGFPSASEIARSPFFLRMSVIFVASPTATMCRRPGAQYSSR
jgi:hypothetical protein